LNGNSNSIDPVLKDRVAIVTGAGRGIGREIALRFSRAGASVVLASRTCGELQELAATISSEGGSAVPWCTDVSDSDSVKHTVAQTIQSFGRIDILVNNAAAENYISSLVLSDDARWKHLFEVNVYGVYFCTKAVLPHMIRVKAGTIINVASVAGQVGAAYNSAYSASKAAIIGFTKSIALEVGGLGITANAICPWHVDTALMRKAMAHRAKMLGKNEHQYLDAIVSSSPQKRLISTSEIAGLALFLTTADARGITGQALNQSGAAVMC
jgi:NAD(P)-dependent dehydrogenase (short-subunit alcohol dehydrogenase family)